MSILSALQRTPDQDKESDAALADSRVADKRKRELIQEAERLHLAVQKRRRELAEAEFANDVSAVETAQHHLAVLEQKLSANEGAQQIAEEKLVDAARRMHLASVDVWLKTARRGANKRLKHASEISEAVGAYIKARAKLLECNTALLASWPLPGLPPEGANFTEHETDRLIEVEILRQAGLNPLSEGRPPGATNNPFIQLKDLTSLVDEIAKANEYAIRTITEGAPSAPSIKPGAQEAAPPSEPLVDPDADLLNGATLSADAIMAAMPKHDAITIDNRANKGE